MRPTLAACFCAPAVLPSATPVDESLEAHSVRTLAHIVYLDSEFGVPQDLPKAGSTLENPYVYDATARELKSMAERGLVRIVGEHTGGSQDDPLIDSLSFVRLR
jgi:hypothetical protein